MDSSSPSIFKANSFFHIFLWLSLCALETFLASREGLGSREMAALSTFSHFLHTFGETGRCSTGSEFYTIAVLFPCSVHLCRLLPWAGEFRKRSPLKPGLGRVFKRPFGVRISSPAIIERYQLQEKVIVSLVVGEPGKGLACFSKEKQHYLQMSLRNSVLRACSVCCLFCVCSHWKNITENRQLGQLTLEAEA